MAGHIGSDRVRAGVIVLPVLLLVSASPVTPQSSGQTEERIKVVGHLPLPGMHVNQMFVQLRGSKHYLYLHRPNRQAFALVDVSHAEKPVLLERATLEAAGAGETEVSKAESTLAVTVTPEEGSAPRSRPPGAEAPKVVLPAETVRLIDLSDPKHPRTLKTFSGVTSMLPDDARHLIYLVNSEGLWIISHRETQAMPYCTSTTALMNAPNCQ